jgi:hypothetical protein
MVAGLDDAEDAAYGMLLLFLALPGVDVLHQLAFHNDGATILKKLGSSSWTAATELAAA